MILSRLSRHLTPQPARTNTARTGGFLLLQFRRGALNSVHGYAFPKREFLAYASIKRIQRFCFTSSQFLMLLISVFLHAGHISPPGSVMSSLETAVNIRTCASLPSPPGKSSYPFLKSPWMLGMFSTLFPNPMPSALLVPIFKFSIQQSGKRASLTKSKLKGQPLLCSVPASIPLSLSLSPKGRVNPRAFASMPCST
jgi:hypothetical protein